jgi:hypothetical protein
MITPLAAIKKHLKKTLVPSVKTAHQFVFSTIPSVKGVDVNLGALLHSSESLTDASLQDPGIRVRVWRSNPNPKGLSSALAASAATCCVIQVCQLLETRN